jgi:F0F1-type ATP synthase assembly protein I
METRRQGIPLFTAVCALIATQVIIQLWLVAAALDALLSGHAAVLIPAAAASLVLFLVNGGLLLHALDFDRRIREREAGGRG